MATAKSRSGKQERPSTVQSVERAVAVLEAMAQARGPRTALELSKATSIHRTIVHRLLKTLIGQKLAAREAPNRYTLGPRALTLGYEYLDGLTVRRVALPYALDLSREVIRDRPWTVSIGVPMGDQLILIERIWGPGIPLNSLLEIGTRLPMEGSAAGRSLLAHYGAGEGRNTLGSERWKKVKPALDKVRRDGGVAFARGELQPGISAIAVPIFENSDRAIAALIVSGPHLEGELRRDSDITNHLKRTANEISQTISRS